MPTLIDTHAHVCDEKFQLDRAETLSRAHEAGVEFLVEIAESAEGWAGARALAHSALTPKVFWTCGFHPHYATSENALDAMSMKRAASDAKCVAIGEIGLDYFRSETPKAAQAAVFKTALSVAADLNKPVSIHCRDAQADCLRILQNFYAGATNEWLSPGVIHCFSGDAHFARAVLDLGFYLGVDGPVTYPSAKALREVLAQAPLERIVLETDCPYLPPQKFRGQRNEPGYLPHIVQALAEVFGVSPEKIAEQTTLNAKRLYRIK